jgi:hypothetical protein
VFVPNYMTGNTRRFRDFPSMEDNLINREDNDVFIYNDHNEKGGRNGIACIGLAIGKKALSASLHVFFTVIVIAQSASASHGLARKCPAMSKTKLFCFPIFTKYQFFSDILI